MRDAGTDPETIDGGGAPNHLRSSLGLPFAALPLIVILDVASASILRSGPVLDGVSLAILCFHVGARAAVLAALLGIAFLLAGAAGRAAGRAGWRRPSPELLLWWAALSAGFLVLADPLTRGMMISRHPRVELLRLLIRVGGPALIACVLVGWSLLPHRLGSLGRRRRAGATFLCLAFGLAVVNLSWLRHYPELHTLLGVLIVAAVLAAVRLVMMGSRWDVARSWRACAGFLLLGGVVFAGGLLARRHAPILPVLAAEDVLAPVVTEWNGITSPLLAFLAPLAPPPVPRRIVVRKADPAEIQAALDEVVPGRRRMNVLWIAVDSLRHDRTGFTPLGPPGGNERRFDENPVTPHLDELAREAFVFRRAYTTYPTSNYAFLSAMTGVPAGATILKTGAETRPDSPAAWPLARVLGDRGWFTLGVTSFQRAHADAPEWFAPLKRGFAVYNPHQEDHGAYASVVTATFLREISKPERRPFFGFLHFFGPHMPYGDAENRVVFGGGSPRLLDLYDSDTRNADEWIGRIIATLRERRLLERSLLVIFSDHGESFGEHGAEAHAGNLYEQQIHVPLMIRIPGVRGRVVDPPVSLEDLLPTTLSFLGIDDPAGRHGRDLLGVMLREGGAEERFAFAEVYWKRTAGADMEVRAVVAGRHKLIQVARHEPTYELYDLFADPGEKHNLFGSPRVRREQERLMALLFGVVENMDVWR